MKAAWIVAFCEGIDEEARYIDGEDEYSVVSQIDEGEADEENAVWYLTDDEAPSLVESNEHTCWPNGYSWPRRAGVLQYEPEHAATLDVNEAYPCRKDDGQTDADDAAYIGAAEMLNGPCWPGIVPAHWQPEAWLTAYQAAYAEAWARKVKEAAEDAE